MGEVSQEHFCVAVTIICIQSKRNDWFLKLSSLMAFFVYGIYAYENLGAFLFGVYISNQVMCHCLIVHCTFAGIV
jgi:hypothetical protein